MLRLLPATLTLFLLLAPAALAKNDGTGWYGPTTDKTTTAAGFILIGGFPLLIFVLSMAQWRLDKRKDARKQAAKSRAANHQWRGGW